MDEFKEEYGKKLSLQNDQLEELKKAFLVFQQKVEDTKGELNRMEANELKIYYDFGEMLK
jgi:hypothetical protein